MPIVDPLSSGFAKVVVGSIFSSKLNLDVVDGSSNVNEVIRAVVNSLHIYFFLEKDFTRNIKHKRRKRQKDA